MTHQVPRIAILAALDALPDASFIAVMVVARAQAEFMGTVIVDDPSPEQALIDAIAAALAPAMGWTPAKEPGP